MSRLECTAVRELIPDHAAGRLGAADAALVERHVAACADCVRELELARAIWAGRPLAPAGLAERLVHAVAADRRPPSRTWWSVSAAAIAALALGIGIASERAPSPPADAPGFATGVAEGDLWLSDDGLVAGAPMLEGLSEEALARLLDDLSTGSAGGAA